MSQLIPFQYDSRRVRAMDVEGEPWFVAADVANILNYSEASAMTRTLDDDEKGLQIVQTPGGEQSMTVISEAGLYSAILRSRVPSAKTFKRWVTHEVLPSIRKRGGYLTPEATEAALTDPDFIIRLATDLKAERARRAELEQQAEADRPKVLFADAVSVSHTSILVGDLAKLIKQNGIDVGGKRLFEHLRRDGYLIARNGTDWNMPTQYSMELGLFEVKETVVSHADGHTSISKTPKVTGKGQLYFVERFLDGRLPKPLKETA